MSNRVFDYKDFLARLTEKPGVYRMLDDSAVTIYVGKAKNLKKRVSSYFRSSGLSPKTRVMVKQIRDIQITITHTEAEALLLENNLIKNLKPRYNILLRDDKSYPYIYLSTKDKYPRLAKHRGARNKPGRYFGPYPGARAVKESLSFLQKVFPVRQCEDTHFSNRSRACLQYQIKRCSGPCVGHISEQKYQQDVAHVILFLSGKSGQLIDQLVEKMDQASKQLDFETAAQCRDQIIALRHIQERQYISSEKGNLDVIALATEGSSCCIQLFMIRDGLNLGNKSFFPKNTQNETEKNILNAFVSQYYLNSLHTHRQFPDTVLLSHEIVDKDTLVQIIRAQTQRTVHFSNVPRGTRKKWLQMASLNAQNALQSRLQKFAQTREQFEYLTTLLQLSRQPQRMECYDISHTAGESTMASCVVFDSQGPKKSDYRRYKIRKITRGDDYAAMRQVLSRRFKADRQTENDPDILLIDGGKGQVGIALEVLNELSIKHIMIMGITKGEGRKAALDTLYLPPQQGFDRAIRSSLSGKVQLPPESPALHLTQQLRDEAHRFAISAHRTQRGKKRSRSMLEDIKGLGSKRRQLLLKQFGGLAEIRRTSVDDLASVKGISLHLAQQIYNHFHDE